MSTIHALYTRKDVYETESATGASVTPISTGDLLTQSVQNWAKAVELWNIALEANHGPHNGGCPDCLGVVTVDPNTGNVTYSNDYYLIGHFSKFVVPGAYHIEADTLGNLTDVAFKNPDGSKPDCTKGKKWYETCLFYARLPSMDRRGSRRSGSALWLRRHRVATG